MKTTYQEEIDLKRLMPRHHMIIKMHLDGKYTHQEIADALGVTRPTVTRVLAMPSTQDLIARKRHIRDETEMSLQAVERVNAAEKAREMLEQASINAAGTLIENLLSGDEKMRNKSANDVLDRVGIARVQKNDNVNKSAVLFVDAETAARIHRTMELDKDDDT